MNSFEQKKHLFFTSYIRYSIFNIRYSIFIFIAFFLPINKLYSQNSILTKEINIELKNTSVEKALTIIEKDINYYFTYDQEIIIPYQKINLSLKKVKLQFCLDSIFFNKNVYYKIIDNHIIIKQKNTINSNNEIEKDSTQKSTEIHGLIIDTHTNKAIPFATVSIEKYSIGVITNIEGRFTLKIPPSLTNEKVVISHIGYENKTEKIDSLVNKNNLFKLKQSFVPIQEIIIRKTDAKTLIKLALKKIPENYCYKANYMTAFYRETIKHSSEFMFFSEAVLKIYKASYKNENSSDQIKVLKSRKMKNITARDTVVLKLKSGLQSAITLDIVKNKIDFLKEENFIYYNYQMTDIVTYNNRTSYAIDFEQKKNVIDALYKGTIYIDTENLAIIGAEFKINPLKISKAQSSFVIKKTRGMKLRVIDTKYIVSYRSINNTFYLSHVRGELKIRVRKRKKLFPTTFETSLELAISHIDSTNVKRFNRKETEKLTSVFSEVWHEYDETFWEDYNFIKPEDSWQEAIKKIHEKLND